MQTPSQQIVTIEKNHLRILNEDPVKIEHDEVFLNENMKVGLLVAKMPGYASVFEKLGIDYCCKGTKTLKELCTEKNLEVKTVLEKLAKVSTTSPMMAWEDASIDDLIHHIVIKHHDYLREELPRISNLIDKVLSKHGDLHLELLELRDTFEGLKDELIKHLDEEETVVFPLIKNLKIHKSAEDLDKLKNYINTLYAEHLAAGAALEKMNALTNGYTPPRGACTTYLVLLNSLAFLEKDMHEHVHKENHILFLQIPNN